MSFKQTLSRYLINLPGWRTNRKIVVIESDDWGSIRMPSRKVYQALLDKGIAVNNWPFNRFDSLASETDLSNLFEVLQSVKDKNGRPAVITANTIVANPDFDKIRASGFTRYFYEPFTETLKRYPEHQKSFEIWKQGINAGVFKPQFHGREHLNVTRWMKALLQNKGNVRLAFDYNMFDLTTNSSNLQDSFMDALNYDEEKELEFQKISITEGTRLFEKIFGYRSKTFIAPSYIWSNQLNSTIRDAGIHCFQGSRFQLEPIHGMERKFRRHFHFTGQRNKLNQIYLVRNASFEPSDQPNFDWISDILFRAQIVYKLGKPLIISSHRLNYIGFIDQQNSDNNLPLLKKLLLALLKKWPNIEFMSSDELFDLIDEN